MGQLSSDCLAAPSISNEVSKPSSDVVFCLFGRRRLD